MFHIIKSSTGKVLFIDANYEECELWIAEHVFNVFMDDEGLEIIELEDVGTVTVIL